MDQWFSQEQHTGAKYPFPIEQTEILSASTAIPSRPFHSMVDQNVPQVTAVIHINNAIMPSQETTGTVTNQVKKSELDVNNNTNTDIGSDDDNITKSELAKNATLKNKQVKNRNEENNDTKTENDSNEPKQKKLKKTKKDNRKNKGFG
eukprot:3863980-Ditylum_brightwellii.AAC.1